MAREEYKWRREIIGTRRRRKKRKICWRRKLLLMCDGQTTKG